MSQNQQLSPPRPRFRRVTRVVRGVDVWSVFKVGLCVNLIMFLVTTLSLVMLWSVAGSTGTIRNIEKFVESYGWERFSLDGQKMFENILVFGVMLSLLCTAVWVIASILLNLVADLVGGIRVIVLEEEVIASDSRN